MRKFFVAALAFIAMMLGAQAHAACTTIQAGTILYRPGAYLAGQPYQTGVDPYGYNYQAHAFNGSFFNVYANGDGFPPYNGDDAAYLTVNPTASSHWAWSSRAIDVAMKWNEGWLSNQDCDGDGAFDRHYGYPSYIGSGALLTNNNSWTVSNGNKDVQANEFIKIVAMPSNSVAGAPNGYFGEGTVYTANGKVMGDRIWGEFAVIQYVLNDPSGGAHGLLLKSEARAGFGFWKP